MENKKTELDKKEVGKKIKGIRLSRGETAEEFGKHFDPPANRGLVSGWENGRYLPSPERLKMIAKIGETTVEKLLNSEVTDDDMSKMAESLIYGTVERVFIQKVIDYHEERLKIYDHFMSQMASIDEDETDNSAIVLLKTLKNEISQYNTFSPKWTPLEQKAFDIINSDNSNGEKLHEYIQSLSMEEIINFLPEGELEKELNKDTELIFEIDYEHETITVKEN